jgi:hypothetical protein
VYSWALDISSLSEYESILLVANYNDVWNGDKNSVSSDLAGRGYTEEQLAHATGRIAETFNPVVSCGLMFTKPFGHLKFEALAYVLTLFENYERGCLPFPGSVSEQPAQIMEVFAVLRQLKHEVEIKMRKAASQSTGTKRQ